MTESIISREVIKARARAAFLRGQDRNSHAMNPGAPALADWLAEYDRLNALASQLNHSALMSGKRVDARQQVAS